MEPVRPTPGVTIPPDPRRFNLMLPCYEVARVVHEDCVDIELYVELGGQDATFIVPMRNPSATQKNYRWAHRLFEVSIGVEGLEIHKAQLNRNRWHLDAVFPKP